MIWKCTKLQLEREVERVVNSFQIGDVQPMREAPGDN